MTVLVAPRALWSDGALHSGLALEIHDGNVVRLRPLGADTPDLRPDLVTPALTDLQVNGGGGVMVNSTPTAEGLRAVVAAHRGLGTGWVLPTVITDAPDVMEAAAEAACAVAGEPGQLGLHIEGPHLAPEKRGTHDPAFLRPLDARTVAVVERLRARGVPVLITLAPERADPALLAALRATGAVLSAGHSMADAAETQTALDSGITCFTHLFNAMPPMLSRAPGIVGRAIRSDAYIGLIADGIHVDWDMLAIAIAARPQPGRCFLVSDAMATVGGPDHFTLYGNRISVRDGALVNAEGALAGAHIDMVTSLRNLCRATGLPLDVALPMVTDTPRAVLGLARQEIAPGWPVADLLALDDQMQRVALPQEPGA